MEPTLLIHDRPPRLPAVAGLVLVIASTALVQAQGPPPAPNGNAPDTVAAETGSPIPPGLIAPGPAATASNLTVPSAERAFGAGEPTTVVGKEEVAEEQEPTPLMKLLGIEDSPVKVYGWIQNSFTGNTNGNGASRTNFGVQPNWQANKWMGNQYYFVIENPLEQEDELNFGFRLDNLFGNDWLFNHMQGLLDGVFQPAGSFAGYDPAQFYAEAHLPILTEGGLDVKGGRWYTLAGYETVPAIARPMLSVPYMFYYGQPFTHMGVLTTLHVSDRVNLYNGTINGWDRFINERYQWGYIGGFSWTSRDERTSLAFTSVWGPNQYPSFLPSTQQYYATGYVNVPSIAGLDNPGYHRNDRTLFTTVLTQRWSDKLTQVIETDQGWERSVPGLASPIVDGVVQNGASKSAQWQSFGNWFLYSFNDKLTGVWRSEIFWDQQGVRTGLNDGSRFVGDRFHEITLGLIWKPTPWIWVRPEARYDWTQFHPAYTDNTRKEQFTLGFDVIVLF